MSSSMSTESKPLANHFSKQVADFLKEESKEEGEESSSLSKSGEGGAGL